MSIFQLVSSPVGISMRTRDSLVSSVWRASPKPSAVNDQSPPAIDVEPLIPEVSVPAPIFVPFGRRDLLVMGQGEGLECHTLSVDLDGLQWPANRRAVTRMKWVVRLKVSVVNGGRDALKTTFTSEEPMEHQFEVLDGIVEPLNRCRFAPSA